MKAEEPDKPWNRNTKVTVVVGEKGTDGSHALGRWLLQDLQESEQDYIFSWAQGRISHCFQH